MLRGAIITSALAVAAQVTSLLAQLAFASLFGSSTATDAYFAALAVPTFVSTVLVASLSMVFVPILVQRRAAMGREDAETVAHAMIDLTALSLAAVAVGGAVLSGPILNVTAPGLAPEAHALATELGRILWPSTITVTLVALLTVLWQIDSRFGWPAFVPLAGAAANLVLLLLLTPTTGIVGAALAWTASSAVQVLLLVPVIARRWRPRLALGHPGVREVLSSSLPLVVANLPIRASTIWERLLASLLAAGELTQLSYASRTLLSISVLFSAGPAAVIFPRLASDAATGDRTLLGRTVERGLRSVWLVVAPAAALLIALSDPGVELVFERGAFSHDDTLAVASLLRVYAPALIAGSLAIVSGRALYALRATKLIAGVAIVEALAYLAYTAALSGILGARGIALGFSVYMSISLAWQMAYLQWVTRALSARSVALFALAGVAAALGGLAAVGVARIAETPLVAVASGGIAGAIVYVGGLLAIQRALGPLAGARGR